MHRSISDGVDFFYSCIQMVGQRCSLMETKVKDLYLEDRVEGCED